MTQFWVGLYHKSSSSRRFLSPRSFLSSIISPAKSPTNHGLCHFIMSYSRSFPLLSSASSISLSQRASLTDIPSCICWDSPTRSSRKLRSGCGLAMRFTIASYACLPSIIRLIIFIEFSQVAFGFSIILFWGDLKQSKGYDSGHWFWGTMLYLVVLLTVLGKAALVSECVRGLHLSLIPLLTFPKSQYLDQVYGRRYGPRS
jgi:hypothetical protein